jgi:hypothetical protein
MERKQKEQRDLKRVKEKRLAIILLTFVIMACLYFTVRISFGLGTKYQKAKCICPEAQCTQAHCTKYIVQAEESCWKYSPLKEGGER